MSFIKIDENEIRKNIKSLKTAEVVSTVEKMTGRTNLGILDDEWWIDFFIGVLLWGLASGSIG